MTLGDTRRTGQIALRAGVYVSQCECAETVNVDRGEPFPRCVTCFGSVEWRAARTNSSIVVKDEAIAVAVPMPARDELAELLEYKQSRSE